MTSEEISKNLHSTRSADRRKAAREIGRQKKLEFGGALFTAYLKERKDVRTWETQYHMILALGLVDYKPALPEIEQIVRLNKSHDMITYGAAQTYVRLKRKSLQNASPVIELLQFGGLSVSDGALNPLAYDNMMPPDNEIETLIRLGWDLHQHGDRIGYERGYSDPRYGLAAACAGWKKELTRDFLLHCISTAGLDETFKTVAEKSLQSKYSKLR